MTRKAHNTERGSIVQLQKRKRKEALRSLFERKDANPSLTLKELAEEYGLRWDNVRRRYQQWNSACAADDASARDAACSDLRGGHNRAFSADQEKLLADIVAAAAPSMTHTQIVKEALQLKCASETFIHQTRNHAPRPFLASPRFITRFKRTHRLSSHRTAVQFTPKNKEGIDTQEACLDFITEVHSALLQYSPSLVLNMDETPVKLIDAPVTGVVITGSKEAAKMETSVGSMGMKVSTLPCISAAGDKLQLSAIIRGKTSRSLRKITENASAAVKKVKLYVSEKDGQQRK
jgi:hypothetical protein